MSGRRELRKRSAPAGGSEPPRKSSTKPKGKSVAAPLSNPELRAEGLDLLGNIRGRIGEGVATDPPKIIQQMRQTRGILEKEKSKRTLANLKRYPFALDGNDPATQAPSLGGKKGLSSSSHGWRSMEDACSEAWGLADGEARTLMGGWDQSDVSGTDEWTSTSLPRDAKKLLKRRVKQAVTAYNKKDGEWLRVLWAGQLGDWLVQLKLDPSNIGLGGSATVSANHVAPEGKLFGMRHGKVRGHGGTKNVSLWVSTEASNGTNIRRVDVTRAGETVASFYLAVYAHPGATNRAATDATLEIPAQLLRDLVNGKTFMETITITAESLGM